MLLRPCSPSRLTHSPLEPTRRCPRDCTASAFPSALPPSRAAMPSPSTSTPNMGDEDLTENWVRDEGKRGGKETGQRSGEGLAPPSAAVRRTAPSSAPKRRAASPQRLLVDVDEESEAGAGEGQLAAAAAPVSAASGRKRPRRVVDAVVPLTGRSAPSSTSTSSSLPLPFLPPAELAEQLWALLTAGEQRSEVGAGAEEQPLTKSALTPLHRTCRTLPTSLSLADRRCAAAAVCASVPYAWWARMCCVCLRRVCLMVRRVTRCRRCVVGCGARCRSAALRCPLLPPPLPHCMAGPSCSSSAPPRSAASPSTASCSACSCPPTRC